MNELGAINMAKHRSGANDKTFVVGLVSLVALRKLPACRSAYGTQAGQRRSGAERHVEDGAASAMMANTSV